MTVAYDVEAVRKAWEGYETPLVWGRYPVEHDPIRRYCHMVDDLNPRYLERGECPPVMVDYFASAGPWPPAELDIISLVRRIPTPGDRLVNLGHEFEWFRTARVGDRLGSRHRVIAVELRKTRLDPLSSCCASARNSPRYPRSNSPCVSASAVWRRFATPTTGASTGSNASRLQRRRLPSCRTARRACDCRRCSLTLRSAGFRSISTRPCA